VLQAEKALAAIWAEALHVEGVGVHDNYFELGGDSILGIQIVTRARAAGLDLSPRDLFEHQTIADLVRHARPLGDAGAESDGDAPSVADRSDAEPPFALSGLSPAELDTLAARLRLTTGSDHER
jgi:aryl carrier-like protein